ncbi:hypothetical protein RJ639_008527 [Escallonia herrerae]|uniref:AT-hook motif nuclear-localized protein n=1 Tax=Escallonia herrerae TaxID=1293975 RepID=A0AA88VQU3_9ASTE|nr:hypothetical protein RJ639_008527 [Escallonia herrerae]
MSGTYNVQQNNAGVQSPMHNVRLGFGADGAAVYQPIGPPPNSSPSPTPTYQHASTAAGGGGGGDGAVQPAAMAGQMSVNPGAGEVKRKRGRPRKYGLDGPVKSPAAAAAAGQTGGFSSPAAGKKARGRPPGSGRKQQVTAATATGSAGVGFIPHVITVKAGEDVLAKLMSFSQNNTRAVCILSANGAISNVTLRQAATSGGSVTYEGRFEILSLSGSFLLSDSGGQRSRTGGLSVSLAGPDGRVLGGGVAGLLTAASPVQVIVGSFIAGQKQPKLRQAEVSAASTKLVAGASATGSPPSRATVSESSGGPGSPFDQSTGACNNNSNTQRVANMPWR